MKQALLFPGQGSQTVGMGKELHAAFSVARAVFQEVDDALSQKLSSLMFEGPSEELMLTENAQPAIMAVSIAALKVMESEAGFSVARDASYVAGHSLGEYSALAAAGALSLKDTAQLLRLRGRAMQGAVAVGQGAMAALLGADFVQAEQIAREASAEGVCAVANDNAGGQVVLSGSKAAVERAVEIAKASGIKRAVMLAVSAPFHCPLMKPAADAMQEALEAVQLKAPCVPLIANMTAREVASPDYIRDLLVEQVTGMVRWRESIEYLSSCGVTRFLEIGAGKVLSGLNKRIAPEAQSLSIGTPDEVRQVFFADKVAA